MENYDTTRLEENCKKLITASGKNINWKWDDRFETVLAEFKSKNMDLFKTLIQSHMDVIWDSNNAKKAPDIVKTVIDYFGGLHKDQLLFTSNPEQDGLLLCAWWPWGNGETISIRLAIFSDALSDADNNELIKIFRGWFGV